MTRSKSAAFPTSSVIFVEGVSGEIATPAFIFRACTLAMISNGLSSDMNWALALHQTREVGCTCRLEVKTVERTACICDIVHPLDRERNV
jgi:hypothetical protein